MLPIIFLIIESYNFVDPYVVENVNVFAGMLAVPVRRVSVLDGSHEGDKFTRNDPIKVAILNTFIILVFFYIEGSEVVPSESYGVFEALEAVEKCAIVEAFTF